MKILSQESLLWNVMYFCFDPLLLIPKNKILYTIVFLIFQIPPLLLTNDSLNRKLQSSPPTIFLEIGFNKNYNIKLNMKRPLYLSNCWRWNQILLQLKCSAIYLWLAKNLPEDLICSSTVVFKFGIHWFCAWDLF